MFVNVSILCDFRNEIEVEEFVGSRAVDVGVKVDGEIVVGELFESNSDRLFCLRLCDGFFSSKIQIKYSILVTEWVTKFVEKGKVCVYLCYLGKGCTFAANLSK